MIPVQFLVVKYVRDAVLAEPLNVGIIAELQNTTLVSRFIQNFERIRALTGQSNMLSLQIALQFLKSSLDRSSGATLSSLFEAPKFGVLQLGEPQGGLAENENEFIKEQFSLYCGKNCSSPT